MLIVSRIVSFFFFFLLCCLEVNAIIENPLLFEIEKDRRTSYLLATNHAISFDEFPSYARDRILSCTILVTETEEVTDKELESMGAFRGKEDPSLKDILSPNALFQFEKVIKPFYAKKGFISNLYDLKPWAAYAAYINGEFINGMDYTLREIFGPGRTKGLMSLHERASYMIDVSIEDLEQFLLNDELVREMYKEELESENDNYRLGLLSIKDKEENDDREVIETNIIWFPKILNIHLNEEAPLIAVGYKHLEGEKGLLNLLKQEKFIIRKINSNGSFVPY